MSCPRKVVADILNNCIRPVRGIKPLAYWAYRSDVTFTYSANEITAIDTIALGSFESVKFGLNAGHDLATSDIADDGYKHKFSGVFNVAANADLDTMEDIVVFVQTNGGVWLCYGAKNGLWKETQVKMSNDNLSTIAVEFGSRKGMEEEYSEYVVDGALLAAIPKTTEYEVITGLSLASGTVTPQVVCLEVDSDKTCKVILPDNTVLTSTVGLINTTWAGDAGNVTLIVPKNTTRISLYDSGDTEIPADFIGIFTSNYATEILCNGCINLTEISAPNAITINASGCALTAVAIAALLAELVATGNEDGTLDVSGGTNAPRDNWGEPAEINTTLLETRGWTITANAL